MAFATIALRLKPHHAHVRGIGHAQRGTRMEWRGTSQGETHGRTASWPRARGGSCKEAKRLKRGARRKRCRRARAGLLQREFECRQQGPGSQRRFSPLHEITGEGLPPLSSDPDRESVYDSESDRSRSLCYRLARNFMRCPHAQTNRPLARRADHGEGPVTGFAKQCSPPHNGDGLLRRVASSQ